MKCDKVRYACNKYSIKVRYYQVCISIIQIFNNSKTHQQDYSYSGTGWICCSSSSPTQWLPIITGIKFEVPTLVLHDLASGHLSDLIASLDTFVPAVPSASNTVPKATTFTSSSFLFTYHYRKVFPNNSIQKLSAIPSISSLPPYLLYFSLCL